MKRVVVSLTAICALAFGVWVVNAAPSNFAGTWELDKANSKLPEQMANVQGITLTVTQDDKTLTYEQKVIRAEGDQPGGGPGGGGGRGGGRGMGGPRTYKLDGTEDTREISAGQFTGKITSKTKWLDGGKGLELVSVSAIGDRTNTTTEHWELADGGKVLKIHRKSESQRGTQESTLTFNKK